MAFTVSTYRQDIKFHDKDVRLCMSLNIQFIILLSEPGEQSFLPPDDPIGIIRLENNIRNDSETVEGDEDVNDGIAASEEAGPSVWI